MENLTGGTPPVRYLLCVVPCKLYFPVVLTAAIPFVWIIAVQHHSALHARFTFRILSVAAAAAITFIVLNVKQAKKQQKSQKIFKKAQ
jgi:hypothetical protein